MHLEHLLARLPHMTDEVLEAFIRDAQHRARTAIESEYREMQLILIMSGLGELAKRKGMRGHG